MSSTWVDKMTPEMRTKYSPETIERWQREARSAKKHFNKQESIHPEKGRIYKKLRVL